MGWFRSSEENRSQTEPVDSEVDASRSHKAADAAMEGDAKGDDSPRAMGRSFAPALTDVVKLMHTPGTIKKGARRGTGLAFSDGQGRGFML